MAARAGIENQPTEVALHNLSRLAGALELIRSHACGGAPIIVTSGYRCTELNRIIGGVPDSNHVLGRAADIICPRMPTTLLFDRIRRMGPSETGEGLIRWDELIEECATWVHFAIPPAGAAATMKTLHSVRDPGGKMRYTPAGPLLPEPKGQSA